MQEIEIWRAAEQMRKMFGPDATIEAARRADKLLDQGDVEGFEMWRRVAAAIGELDRVKPRSNERKH